MSVALAGFRPDQPPNMLAIARTKPEPMVPPDWNSERFRTMSYATNEAKKRKSVVTPSMPTQRPLHSGSDSRASIIAGAERSGLAYGSELDQPAVISLATAESKPASSASSSSSSN